MKWSPHGRWRSLPPEGAGRERPGEAGSAAPLNFDWGVRAAAPGRHVPLAHGLSLSRFMLACHLIPD